MDLATDCDGLLGRVNRVLLLTDEVIDIWAHPDVLLGDQIKWYKSIGLGHIHRQLGVGILLIEDVHQSSREEAIMIFDRSVTHILEAILWRDEGECLSTSSLAKRHEIAIVAIKEVID